jgi:hypothetical protein
MTLSGEQLEKGTVTAVRRVTTGATPQMFPDPRELFRPQLTVEILPEPAQNLFTFHSLNPHQARLTHRDAALQNRGEGLPVPGPAAVRAG